MSLSRRDWADARRKVEEEGHCRVCGAPEEMAKIEAAHLISRTRDGFDPLFLRPRRKNGSWKVEPSRIIPLCGPFPEGCHGDYDEKRLDILSFLTLDEQVQAVRDAGGIELARRRLCPVAYRREV